MNRAEYLRALSEALSGRVSGDEREDILRYYEEYFDEAGPEGTAALIDELGDPFALAGRLTEEGGFVSKGRNRTPSAGRSRGRKIALIVIGCLLAVGLLDLAVFRLLFGSRSAPQPSPPATATVPAGAVPPAAAQSQTPAPKPPVGEQFSSIELDIAVGSVELRTGDGYDVELEWNEKKDYTMTAAVERGVLQVSSSKPVHDIDTEDYDAHVRITVPQGAVMDGIKLAVGVGSVSAEGITADGLGVATGVGSVTAEDCAVKRSIDLTTGMGNVSAEDCTAERSIVLETGMGTAELYGPLAGKTGVSSGMGKVTVRTSTAAADCAYDIECGMGTLTVDGGEYTKEARKARGSVKLDCSSGMGNVNVTFGAN